MIMINLYLCILFICTENVPANNTIWILGDNLLREASGHYEKYKKTLKEQKIGTQDNRLYIDKHYAVKIISPGMYIHGNTPVVILDGLVETLNHNPKIPHTIILMVNDRKFWNNKEILDAHMDRILQKFFKEFNKILDMRKYSLDEKAVNWDYPRLIVTRPLPLPSNLPAENYPTGFRSNRRKFNRILDKQKEDAKISIANFGSFTSQNKDKLFKDDGSISEKGYDQIWIDLSDTIHKDDEKWRILTNKFKAKQIAKELTAELMASDDSDLECTGVTVNTSANSKTREVTKKKSKKKSNASPARRSLSSTFDSIHEKTMKPSQSETKQDDNGNPTSQRKQHKHHKHQFQGYQRRPHARFPGFPRFFHPNHYGGYGPSYFHY